MIRDIVVSEGINEEEGTHRPCVCDYPSRSAMTEEQFKAAQGHFNEAGGYCCKHHGNTCGYCHQYDGVK